MSPAASEPAAEEPAAPAPPDTAASEQPAAPAARDPAARDSGGWAWLVAVAAVVALADLAAKSWVRENIARYETLSLLDGWAVLIHRSNTGIAFGLLDGSSVPWLTPILIAVAILGVALLAQLARASSSRLERFAIALIIGGAIGNVIDRIAFGAVTDFMLVRYFPFVFNVADAAITVGGILFAGRIIVHDLRAREPAEAGESVST